MGVRSLGWEASLEEGTATHSSTLAWRIPWTEEPGELQSIRSQRFWHEWSNLAHMPRHRNTWLCASLYRALQIPRAFLFLFLFFSGCMFVATLISRKDLSTIFPTAFVHFIFLCHILVIPQIFQAFPLLLYLLWWSVIHDLWFYYCNCLGESWSMPPIKDSELNQ